MTTSGKFESNPGGVELLAEGIERLPLLGRPDNRLTTGSVPLPRAFIALDAIQLLREFPTAKGSIGDV